MTYPIIITICSLVLLAYVFNITSSKTRIPSVVILLLIGWLARQIANYLNFSIPDLNPILPIIGAIGLILIVLEGSLDLEFEKGKNREMFITAGTAFFSILFLCLILGGVLHYHFGYTWQIALVNAIPLTIISSSVAIPAAQNLGSANRKFVILDSSISDILGIVAFYFFANNTSISSRDFLFLANILLLIVVALAASFILLLLLIKTM
jgi:potassium/hydrogen antiporter